MTKYAVMGLTGLALSVAAPPAATLAGDADASASYFKNLTITDYDDGAAALVKVKSDKLEGGKYRADHGDQGYEGADGRYGYRGPAPRLTLYAKERFRGHSLELGYQGASNLAHRGFNDKAYSLRVDGGRWQICMDSHYRSRCREVSSDVGDLRSLGMHHTISSVRLLDPDPAIFANHGPGGHGGYGGGHNGYPGHAGGYHHIGYEWRDLTPLAQGRSSAFYGTPKVGYKAAASCLSDGTCGKRAADKFCSANGFDAAGYVGEAYPRSNYRSSARQSRVRLVHMDSGRECHDCRPMTDVLCVEGGSYRY